MEKEQMLKMKEKIEDYIDKQDINSDDKYWLFKLLYKEVEEEVEDFFYADDEELDAVDGDEPEIDLDEPDEAADDEPDESSDDGDGDDDEDEIDIDVPASTPAPAEPKKNKGGRPKKGIHRPKIKFKE